MKYFSAFSGIGGFELGMPLNWECVGYSEIDPYAVKVYQKHFPNHRNFGDIAQIDIDNLPDFDLLVGGFPCQDLSIAKKDRKGLGGERSGLFYKLVEILEKKKPKWFLLENVNSMSRENRDEISRIIGVEPIMINASLVSAQSRKRLFWCNWKTEQPQDRGILLKDILEENPEEKFYVKSCNNFRIIKSIREGNQKSKSLTASMWKGAGSDGMTTIRVAQINKGGQGDRIRKLTPIECARLQCFPDNWCEELSVTRQYKAYGNAVNVEVIRHIISFLN